MLFINRLLMIGLLGVGITAATTAQAAVQLFTAEWYTESFGNECAGTLTPKGSPAPHCTITTPKFTAYAITAIPMGVQCNPMNPRCPIYSTPTSGMGAFHPLGGKSNPTTSINCANLSTYGTGNTVRPAKGATPTGTMTFRIPPLYRNPIFFTSGGQPKVTSCNGTSTGVFTSTQTRFGADKGVVQKGNPVAGSWSAMTTGGGPLGGITIAAAPLSGPYGIRATSVIGQVPNTYPYIYSYTYADIRNGPGTFGPSQGPGSFNYQYTTGGKGSTAASITVKQGKNKFGGTMKMLGALTTKVCYWLRAGGGGCSLGVDDWRYDAIGATAPTMAGVVTMGNTAYTNYTRYYNTAQGAYSALTVIGVRFPWTTGALTVTAVGRGPHKTVHYANGYDNRNTTTGLGKGTVQLVTPILTRWFGYADYETAGIGVLRIKFIPEPQTWVMLVAGVSLLGVATRLRGR